MARRIYIHASDFSWWFAHSACRSVVVGFIVLMIPVVLITLSGEFHNV